MAFTSTPPDSAYVGDTYEAAATAQYATSGLLPVISSLTQTVCTVADDVVTFIAPGICTIAADQPGKEAVFPAVQVTQTVTVLERFWPFSGFLAPYKAAYTVKAGSLVPVRFSLNRYRGLGILAGSPTSIEIVCSAGSAIGFPSPGLSAGNKSLSYDPLTDTYTYSWATNKSWAGSCRRFTLHLADGSSHSFNLLFR